MSEPAQTGDIERKESIAGQGDYTAYGEGIELFRYMEGQRPSHREIIFEGVAGCGKTRLLCEWVVELCNRYPGTKILIFRKTRVSLNDSVLDILENEVLGPDHPAVLGGAQRMHRHRYEFPNRSEIVLGGMDNPTRMFSTQYHVAWCNEVQELQLEDWELIHRALRRPPPGPPFRLLVGDCNPDTYTHWANQRCMPDEDGNAKARRLVGRFWDNPRYFNHAQYAKQPDKADQCWTPEGVEYLGGLRGGLTGVRLDRLFRGLWVSAEGIVWDTFDPHRHIVDGELEREPDGSWTFHWARGLNSAGETAWEPVPLRWFAAGMDFGFDAPGCLHVYGFDLKGRAFLVEEVYRRQKDLDWWADAAEAAWERFRYKVGLADHEPRSIRTLNARMSSLCGRNAPTVWREWSKKRDDRGEKAGIDQVRVRFKQDKLFILRGCQPLGVDPNLRERRQPVGLAEEIPSWVYTLKEDGRPYKDEPDPGCADHACDTVRGVMEWAFLKDLTPSVYAGGSPFGGGKYPRGTYGDLLGHAEVEDNIRRERRGLPARTRPRNPFARRW